MRTFPIVRGLIIVLGFTWGVPLLSFAVLMSASSVQHGALMNASFGLVLTWTYLFLPHANLFPTLFGAGTAIGLSLTQWTLTGIVVGHLTRSMTHWRAAVVAILSIAAVSLTLHALIRVAGYRVIVEGP